MTSTGDKRKSLEQEEFTPQKSNFEGDYAFAESGCKKKCLEQDEFTAQEFSLQGDYYAFAESGVLICHVLVYNMKPLMQQKELLEYCSGLGVVKKCDVVAAKDHHSDVGFVLFVDPKSAAEMLKCSAHYHHNKTFSVGAACDRHQPDFNYSSDTSILNLNEDCLLMIFEHLSIEEQLQCVRASQYFRDIFRTKFNLKYKYFASYHFWLLAQVDIEDIFHIAGDCMIGASIGGSNKFLLDLVIRFCPNLQKVSLECEGMGLEFIEKIRPSVADKIIEMDLDDEFLDDKAIKKMQKLKNLEVLTILDDSRITGAYLENFSKLKEVRLCACKNLKQDHFVNAIKNMKDLRSIDITYCIKFKNSLTDIIKYTPKLERLHIYQEDSSLENIHELQFLKEFAIYMDVPELYFNPNSALKIFIYLKDNAQYIGQLKNLENLRIHPRGFIGVRDYQFSNIEGLLLIIKSCTKLRSLDVAFIQFTEQGFKDIFDLLKSMTVKGERNHALTLISLQDQTEPIERKIIEKYRDPSILEFRISLPYEV